MAQKILTITKEHFIRGLAPSEFLDAGKVLWTADGIDLFYPDYVGRLMAGFSPTDISGSEPVVVADAIKWFSFNPAGTYAYAYGNEGKIYKIALTTDEIEELQTTALSTGQGLEVYKDYLIYSQNTQVGKYGLLSGTPTFDDDGISGATGLTTSNYHPIKVGADKRCYVGDINELDSFSSVGEAPSSDWSAGDLVFSSDWTITALENDGFYLVIGTVFNPGTTAERKVAVSFWDMAADRVNRHYILPGATTLHYLLYKDGWVYAFCQNAIYRCRFDAPPEVFLQRDGIYCGMTYGQIATVYKNVMLWLGSAGKVHAYGSSDFQIPPVFYNPYKVLTTALGGIMGFPNYDKIYTAAGSGDKLYALNIGNVTGVSATTPFIDLGRYWQGAFLKVYTEPLADGDSLAVNVYAENGVTAILSKTFTYAADGAKSSKKFPITAAFMNQIQVALTFTAGAVKVKGFELYGVPVDELYAQV